jgi:hypothetical protein
MITTKQLIKKVENKSAFHMAWAMYWRVVVIGLGLWFAMAMFFMVMGLFGLMFAL